MKRQRPSRPSEQQLAERSTSPSSAPFHGVVLPPDLFSSRVTALRAYRHRRTKKSAARFFLFERTSDATATATATANANSKAHHRRRPPPRPVSSMLNFVQVLTAPTADTPGTCLLVHHDNRRYLFGNVAEGTQRTFVQQKVSLSRVEEIFLTGPVGWHTAGGLLGMILTVAEVVSAARAAAIAEEAQKAQKAEKAMQAQKAQKAGKKGGKAPTPAAAPTAPVAVEQTRSLDIHGGINLTQLLATARRFVFRKGMPIRPHEVREDPASAAAAAAAAGGGGEEGSGQEAVREADWADDNMMVWYVPVTAGGAKDAEVPPPSSTLKRSHDAMDGEDAGSSSSSSWEADRAMVESVVKHMFDSDWKLDALVETSLHAAKLPAKLFVRDEAGHLQVYTGPLPGEGAEPVPDVPVLVRQPWPGALIEALPRTAPSRQSLCYVVRNHARRGKVDAAAAARLGVAKRDIRRLVNGESVTAVAADGSSRTVTPDMVVGPAVAGAAFAVVDLPDGSFVDAFVARPEWTSGSPTTAGGLLAPVDTMFWILGPGLAADPRLLAFMRRFPAVRHVVAAPDACANRLALGSAATLQAKHHRIDPDRFPLPHFDNAVPATAGSDADEKPPYQLARAGWAVRLAPQVVEEDNKVFADVDFADALRELDPAVLTLADGARAAAAAAAAAPPTPSSAPPLPHPDTEVISLGTGSAMPSKYRNVSATLVRVPGVGSYLFDCGENTLGSMRRMLGAAGLAEALRELRAIWISHLHADHHLGTASVIRAWRDATGGAAQPQGQPQDQPPSETQPQSQPQPHSQPQPPPRLMVASHINMLQWLQEYAEVEDLGLDRLHLVELDSSARFRRVCPTVTLTPAETAEFGVQRIDACRVEHCHGALATVFTWPRQPDAPADSPPLRVAYSGDCRPSGDFAALGRDATLLIHESTFDDELAGEAVAKKHSTMGEALHVARRMAARRVLLTHFSQRYPKIPLFADDDDQRHDAAPPGMHVLVAFDHMRVRLRDFQAAAAFLPALQKLYDGEDRG